MQLSKFYNSVVKFGKDCDPRFDKKAIKSFADSAILYGRADAQIKKILVGIDIEAAELLLADRIRNLSGLDLVLTHHPEGKAYACLHNVMQIQVDVLVGAGVDKSVARQYLGERQREVGRRLASANHMRAVDVARLLDLPFMCVHTPADNHVFVFVKKLLDKSKPSKVADIVDILLKVEEYKQASKESCGPRIIIGNPNRAAGKILVEMTGGTEGSPEVYGKLYKTGIRTLVCMHLSEEHFKKVKDANLNVVIAGHISSDTLGLNLLLDRLEKQALEQFTILDCSGFRRVRRKQ
jgi:putative NIF3 family GTP cyclohydrolase 1 type 2